MIVEIPNDLPEVEVLFFLQLSKFYQTFSKVSTAFSLSQLVGGNPRWSKQQLPALQVVWL